ncbi:MAG TPA: hypothetical protein VGL26_10485 [Jatrophihabitans sp.]
MRPTINDQVDGARRLLTGLLEDDEVPAAACETLTNARRLLDQIGRSWAALPGFYARDNTELAQLLQRMRTAVPMDVAARIAKVANAPAPPAVDVNAGASHNAELRQSLSDLLHAMPAGPGRDAARGEIGDYLRRRMAADPA